jgi:hypothetical protein
MFAHLQDVFVVLVDLPDRLGTFADPFGIDVQDFSDHGGKDGQRDEAQEEFRADAHTSQEFLSDRFL